MVSLILGFVGVLVAGTLRNVIAQSAEPCLQLSMFRNCLGLKHNSVSPTVIRVNASDIAFNQDYRLEKSVATASFQVCPGGTSTYSFSCELIYDDIKDRNHEVI